MDQPALADLVRAQRVDALAAKAHLALQHDVAAGTALGPLLEADQPGYGAQERGLSRAVGADHTDKLALAHLERDVAQDHGLVVADREVLHLKERHARSPGRPRPPSGSSRPRPAGHRQAPRRGP